MLLKATDLNVYYGAIHAIKGVSFEVNEGEIVTLIGANGAGKSTTLKTISGMLRSRTGSVEFEGKDKPKHKQGQTKARARKYGTVLRPPSTNHTHPKGQNLGPPMQQGVLSIKVSRETLKRKSSLKQALRENDKRRE